MTGFPPIVSPVGTVHWDLVKVGSESVALGVVVDRHAALQHLVRAGLDPWHQVRRAEGYLLYLKERQMNLSVFNFSPQQNSFFHHHS